MTSGMMMFGWVRCQIPLARVECVGRGKASAAATVSRFRTWVSMSAVLSSTQRIASAIR